MAVRSQCAHLVEQLPVGEHHKYANARPLACRACRRCYVRISGLVHLAPSLSGTAHAIINPERVVHRVAPECTRSKSQCRRCPASHCAWVTEKDCRSLFLLSLLHFVERQHLRNPHPCRSSLLSTSLLFLPVTPLFFRRATSPLYLSPADCSPTSGG